ncbi:30S ribosome-binding factor RbfA [Halocola ammonii]
MPSIRQEKIANVIKQSLAVIFQQQSHMLFGGMFITVTQVRITPDLKLAKVYLSFMAVKDKKEALKKVQSEKNRIRKHLGEEVGKQLRLTPDLQFYIDDSIDYAQKINELLK